MPGRAKSKIDIRLKIFLVVLPLVTLPLALVGTLSYLYMRENGLRILEDQLEIALRSTSSEIIRELNTAKANLDLFATNEIIGRYLSLPESTRYRVMQPAVLDILSDYRRAYPQYVEIGIFLPDGRIDTLVKDQFLPAVKMEDFKTRLISESPKYAEKMYFHNVGSGYIDYVIAQRVSLPDLDGGQQQRIDYENPGYVLVVLRIADINLKLSKALDQPEGLIALTSSTGEPYFSTLTMNDDLRSIISKVVNSGIGRLRSINIDDQYYLGGFYRIAEHLLITGVITQGVIDRVVNPIVWGVIWSIVGVVLLSVLLIYSRLHHLLLTPLRQLKQHLLDMRDGREMTAVDVTGDEFGELMRLVTETAESRRMADARLKDMSYFDSLTGLPNRQAFNKILDKAVNLASRQDLVLAVLYLDINNFREINERYGYNLGDELVKEASNRLQSCLRLSDEVSRQVMSESGSVDRLLIRSGGDEFTVLLKNIQQAHQAAVVANRIIQQFERPVEVQGVAEKLGVSIGIALYPIDGQSPDLLLKSADLAMYDAKQQGGSRYRFFTHALNASSEKRLGMESALLRSIEHREFELYLQPKVALSSGIASEFDAVMRWRYDDGGLMAPEQYMGVVESSGLSIALDEVKIEKICESIERIRGLRPDPVRIAFDVSSRLFFGGLLLQTLDRCMQQHGVQGHELEIELGECVFQEKPEGSDIGVLLKGIKDRGIRLTLDEFGQGDVSLSVFQKYPFDRIKMASTLVRDLELEVKNMLIADAVFKLAHSLDLEVIVQGVEKNHSLMLVKRLGADFVQGQYLQGSVKLAEIKTDFRDILFSTSPSTLQQI